MTDTDTSPEAVERLAAWLERHDWTVQAPREMDVAAATLRALSAENARLRAGLKDVIGMLDDPTGAEHVRDMRGATLIARAALQEGK